MVTKNIRIVGYLPPHYHDKLREYIEANDLSESAALVRIVKQFFDSPVASDGEVEARLDRELASLRVEMTEEMTQMRQRLGVLEAALATSTRTRSYSQSRNSASTRPAPTLPSQTSANLARRLGVTAESLKEAQGKGEEHFKNWTKHRDPGKRAWVARDGRFHPL
ncbi:hypothetical protein IQ235_02715 [Oscillatoriales cyanobacterium LEGE 11467]|uniref:Uncharacterized protein n=1 Tax=Zarconia navalis LEGE 11467 TaxID=1828826 RepID=A0A928VVX4_9CYAN|nr:hypothetical protein [Zarconia navalis]MBE9039707.1 hypothetical protein [Zarconia navalis LEGE 11467]